MNRFHRRRPLVQVLLIALASALGIGSRRFARRLPWAVAAYAGDTLWAFAAFSAIGLILPRASTRTVAVLAMAFAVAVEAQPVVPCSLDRLDSPHDARRADPGLRVPLERSGLLRSGCGLGCAGRDPLATSNRTSGTGLTPRSRDADPGRHHAGSGAPLHPMRRSAPEILGWADGRASMGVVPELVRTEWEIRLGPDVE